MIPIIGILLFLVFFLLSALHIYWASGGRWGSAAVIPTKNDDVPPSMPGSVPTLIVAAGLLACALLVLVKAGMVPLSLPTWPDRYGLQVLSGLFLLRAIGEFRYVGFFKRYRHTKFGRNDTRFYSPLCLVTGLLLLALAYYR